MAMPEADSGYVMLSQMQHDELLKVLPDSGASATVNVAAAGTEMRAGVTFTCASEYPCTVTVTNSLGTIVATWASKKLPDGMAGVMAMGHEPPHVADPLAELNEGSASAIANIINVIINVTIDAPEVATPGSEAPGGAYSGANNALGGFGSGSDDAMNIRRVTLTSSLNPNAATYTPAAYPDDDAMGGSTLMDMNKDGTYADYDQDAPNSTVALEGWNHKVLFRDWGDTAADDDDGGFETGALIYSGMMAPTADKGWLVYGAWLTTPNNVHGVHRVGVFFDGMSTYGTEVDVDGTPTANNVFVADNGNGLRGTATYSGGAAGVYVNRTASGMFTATASLTANFDVGGDATHDSGDYTLSGSIHDFKDTAGTYLGNDTAAHPNDPVYGGNNDWVVLLTAADLTGNTADTISADGAITRTGGAAGSADGVLWTGDWNAQLYGAGDTVEDAVAPAGVAGSFRAITANIGDDGVGDNPPPAYRGVVGAFGATKDE